MKKCPNSNKKFVEGNDNLKYYDNPIDNCLAYALDNNYNKKINITSPLNNSYSLNYNLDTNNSSIILNNNHIESFDSIINHENFVSVDPTKMVIPPIQFKQIPPIQTIPPIPPIQFKQIPPIPTIPPIQFKQIPSIPPIAPIQFKQIEPTKQVIPLIPTMHPIQFKEIDPTKMVIPLNPSIEFKPVNSINITSDHVLKSNITLPVLSCEQTTPHLNVASVHNETIPNITLPIASYASVPIRSSISSDHIIPNSLNHTNNQLNLPDTEYMQLISELTNNILKNLPKEILEQLPQKILLELQQQINFYLNNNKIKFPISTEYLLILYDNIINYLQNNNLIKPNNNHISLQPNMSNKLNDSLSRNINNNNEKKNNTDGDGDDPVCNKSINNKIIIHPESYIIEYSHFTKVVSSSSFILFIILFIVFSYSSFKILKKNSRPKK